MAHRKLYANPGHANFSSGRLTFSRLELQFVSDLEQKPTKIEIDLVGSN